MIKILFLHKSKLDASQKLFINQLTNVLITNNCIILESIESIPACDCIILYETYLINNVAKANKNYNRPVIICLQTSEVAKKYNSLDIKKIDFVFLFGNKDAGIIFPYQKLSRTLFMPFNFITNGYDSSKMANNMQRIYVNIDKMSLFETEIKLVRILNQLTQYDIILQTNNKQLSNSLNSNIKIISQYSDIGEQVQNSDIVIGSGYTSLYAIANNKPCITIGEKGYGGLLTLENIEDQYKSFFQGRIGGRCLEMLPEKLIVEDVQDIINHKTNNASIQLLNFVNKMQSCLLEEIKYVIQHSRVIGLSVETELIFNSDFTIIKSKDKYWIMNRYDKKIHGWIEEDQYKATIEKFIEKNSLLNVLKDVPVGKQKKIITLINEFINCKILTPFIV